MYSTKRFKTKDVPSWEKIIVLWEGMIKEYIQDTITLPNFMLLLFHIWYGKRINEIRSLTIDSFNLDRKVIYFKQLKTGAEITPEDVLPIYEHLERFILEYLRELSLIIRKHLFVRCERQLRNVIYRYTKKYFGVRTRPHAFRHALGIRVLETTGDIERARRLLGHSSIEITRIYAKHTLPDLKNKKWWEDYR